MDTDSRIDEIIHYMSSRGVIKLEENGSEVRLCVPNPESNLFSFYCSLVWPVVESYWISCLYLFKLSKDSLVLPLAKLQSETQWFGQSLFTERIILHLEAISSDTLKNASAQLMSMGIIKLGSHGGKSGVKVVVSDEILKKV